MRIIITTSLFALAISTTNVSATCNQASLQGIWHYFATNTVLREDGSVDFTFLEDCTFGIGADGVPRGSTCIDGTRGVPWGNTGFVVNEDCSIADPDSDLCLLTGQIAKNKQTVTGIGHCCCFEDEAGSENFILPYQNAFTLVKKSSSNGGIAATTAKQVEPTQVARRGRR